MRVFVEGVGIVGPGLQGWTASRAILAGEEAYRPGATMVAASELLPAFASLGVYFALLAFAGAFDFQRRNF